MACLKGPALPQVPSFVTTLQAAIKLPGISAGLCCNLPVAVAPTVLPPLPPIVLLAPVLSAINAAVDAVNAALDQIQVSCPFE